MAQVLGEYLSVSWLPLLGLAFDLGEGDLTIPVSFSSVPPWHHLQKQVHRVSQQGH